MFRNKAEFGTRRTDRGIDHSMPKKHQLPAGFRAAGHACGIKSDPQTLDLALFVSDRPCAAAGVFTQNVVVGAPVHICRQRLPRETARGVVINSGNANACTGQRGLDDARSMCAKLATQIDCPPEDILVCSTGVIGHFLPIDKLEAGIQAAAARLADGESAFLAAARGMMTTDTVPKQASRSIAVDSGEVTICGACKGAAMIAPNMATMLAVVMTDARLSAATAQTLLQNAVDHSFNRISVDQHTSTSDTVLLLANGASGVEVGGDSAPFREALEDVCRELALQIVRDAEGAEHFVTVNVSGAQNHEDAVRIARSVADSPLVKTAVTGNDPNWGRIVSAAGYAGVPFAESECSLSINGHPVYQNGAPTNVEEGPSSQAMRTGEVVIELSIGSGPGACRFWTSDLTAEYVRLNSEYTT